MQPTENISAPDTTRLARATEAAVTKVPAVTAGFWVLKILTTGMGEAASDALVRWGGVVAVAMVGIFGTMAADIPHFLGIPLWVTSLGYLLAVLAIFATWYRLEGTLSFSSITRGRSESFYWAAVVATFALGTAVGDLTADS
jgi:uncharacterized membrane-anchored protein